MKVTFILDCPDLFNYTPLIDGEWLLDNLPRRGEIIHPLLLIRQASFVDSVYDAANEDLKKEIEPLLEEDRFYMEEKLYEIMEHMFITVDFIQYIPSNIFRGIDIGVEIYLKNEE